MQIWSEETANHWRSHYDGAAVHWGKWADQLAEQQEKINQGLLAAAGVKPGAKLLDLASGAGEPALTASRLVGAEGQVTATDISAPMVAVLAERLARHGLTNVRCEQADMEALPFADASFDAVSCRYGLMYARDPACALAEAARVVRPGGRIAFMVWGPEQNNSVLYVGLRAANAHLGSPIAEADFLVPSRYAEPGVVAKLMTAAGIADARERRIDLRAEDQGRHPVLGAVARDECGRSLERADGRRKEEDPSGRGAGLRAHAPGRALCAEGAHENRLRRAALSAARRSRSQRSDDGHGDHE